MLGDLCSGAIPKLLLSIGRVLNRMDVHAHPVMPSNPFALGDPLVELIRDDLREALLPSVKGLAQEPRGAAPGGRALRRIVHDPRHRDRTITDIDAPYRFDALGKELLEIEEGANLELFIELCIWPSDFDSLCELLKLLRCIGRSERFMRRIAISRWILSEENEATMIVSPPNDRRLKRSVQIVILDRVFSPEEERATALGLLKGHAPHG